MGFVGGINSIAPLIPVMAPDIAMTVRVVLEDTGDEAYIDLARRPPRVVFDGKNKSADVVFWTNSADFHDILGGKLNPIKAWNDKRALVEMVPNALATMPMREPTDSDDPVVVPGFVYEMYLTGIGAHNAFDNPPVNEEVVQLEPGKKGVFARLVGATAWTLGVVFGVFLRIVMRFSKEEDPDEIPDIEWHEVEEVPKPDKSKEPGKIIRSMLRWFFRRVDMFELADSFISGAKAVKAV